MKAAYYESFKGPIEVVTLPDPVASRNGVVIKVEASGLCLSDWHGWMGHDPDIQLPHVPGHELAGTVLSLGKGVNNFQVGDRITVPFVCGCGQCQYCLQGDQQVCDQQFQPGFTAWGSFAEYVAIEYADENLVLLPEEMGFAAAASLGCRFITAYRAVRDQGKLIEGQKLAVHGCGGVGLSAIQIGKALGAEVIAVDITDEKCNFASEIGADYVFNSTNTNVAEAVKDITSGGVHVSIDALGHTETCLNSIKSLRKRGKHIQVGLMTGSHQSTSIPMSTIIADELEILGSHGMQAHKYPEMFGWILQSKIDLSALISEKITLQQLPQYLPQLQNRDKAGIVVVDSFPSA